MSGRRQLEGWRVLVLRPENQAGTLADLLRSEGAEPVEIPAVRIVDAEDPTDLDSVVVRLGVFDWLVFTSVNGAEVFLRRLKEAGALKMPHPVRIAAIGPVTAERLEAGGLNVDWMPSAYTTRALGNELPMSLSDPATATPGARPRVCLLRADIASTELDEALTRRGFEVERVDVYGTEPINGGSIRQAVSSVDAVALTSASIAESFANAAAGALPENLAVFSIGPATSEACRTYGLPLAAEAKEHTVRGLVEVLQEYRKPA